MNYKFSVIIPAYNCEAFIGETVECLLAQSLKDIQIVIVDDGATDSTGKIIDSYAEKFSNIIALHQPNGGVSSARNHGLKYAEGKYCMFHDSDDLLEENTLELIYNRMEAENAGMAIIRLRRFGFGSEEDNPITKELSEEKLIDCFDKRLIWNFPIGNKAFRTEALLKSGVLFPPTSYTEDGAFNMSFVYSALPKITGVPNAVSKYRRCDPIEHPSVTQRISMKYLTDFCASMEIVKAQAEIALSKPGCVCADKDDYRQELIRKTYCTLMNEFYRLLWGADDKCLAFISEKCSELRSLMTAENIKKCDVQYKELGKPLPSRRAAADAPEISIKVKNAEPSEAFIRSIYHQSMPKFELLLKKLPDEPVENMCSLSEKPKGKIVITLSGKKAVDSRLLRVIYFLKTHPKFGIFPPFIVKCGAFLFLKFKK